MIKINDLVLFDIILLYHRQMDCNHNHANEHVLDDHCHDDNHEHTSICHQCGKVHSVYFIKEHHCLEETLSVKKESLHEQCSQKYFSTRAPPLLIN